MINGIVYLVGAGPGDAQLLTVKAVELIKKANVIVYDRLVSQSIMELIPDNTKLINVGKNVGNHPVPQSQINEILLQQALLGNTVVRLKGGDPFIFGRGGEELELLAKNNIPFEVVPGITSSISVPAYAGIPVTHRDYCSSLHIITGHAKRGCEIEIDFDTLVKLNGTLIFMMSVSTIGQIASGLIKANMDKQMPCAVIENGTYSNQRKFISTIDNIEQTVNINNVKSPAVIIVGKVCELSESFDWFTKKPLKNTKILVTQPKKKSSNLANNLRELGADAILYPCIKTEFIRPLKIDFEPYNVLVFTSCDGVQSFFEWLISEGLDARSLANKKIACVGSQTANELKRYGIVADFVPNIFDGEHLATEMIKQKFINNNDNILLLRAKKGTEDLTKILENNNIAFTDCPVYETHYIENKNAININEYDFITFTSKSCVEGFIASYEKTDFSHVKAVCIGSQTADKAKEYGFETIVSQIATTNSMVDRIVELKGM